MQDVHHPSSFEHSLSIKALWFTSTVSSLPELQRSSRVGGGMAWRGPEQVSPGSVVAEMSSQEDWRGVRSPVRLIRRVICMCAGYVGCIRQGKHAR